SSRTSDLELRYESFEVLGALATRSRVDKIGNGRASPWRFDQRRGLCEERRRHLRRPRAREWTPGSGGVAARSYPLPIPPKQFVHAEREIGAHSEEQRSPGSRKNREIEGRLHSQRHRHRQSKSGQKSSAQQGNDASVPTDNEEKTEQRFSRRGDHRQPRNRRRRQKPIKRGRIVYESSIVAPPHIGLSINAPEAKPVCDGGQERDPEREAYKYRAERCQAGPSWAAISRQSSGPPPPHPHDQ